MTPVTLDPRARELCLHSAALGIEKHFFVYQPPDLPPGQSLPVLYLLRGHEREWINPTQDDSRSGTTVIDAYERLRSAGLVGPMLLVMPGLSSDDGSVPGLLDDLHAPGLAADKPGIGSGRFAGFFFNELLPFIDGHFHTDPRARSVAGFSLGGYMAIKAAALRPDLFVSVGAFDGSFTYASDGGLRPRPGDTIFASPMFDPTLGLPRDPAALAASNLAVQLLKANPATLRRITWIIQYGPEQLEPWGSNFYRGEYLLRLLTTLGIANAAPCAALPDGQHTWHMADRHIEETLPIHWQAMQKALSNASQTTSIEE